MFSVVIFKVGQLLKFSERRFVVIEREFDWTACNFLLDHKVLVAAAR